MTNLRELKSFGIMPQGTYSAATTYYKDDVVVYNNAPYICIVNNTLNVLPTNTSNWSPFLAAPVISVATTGTGTNPANFTLTVSGNTVTLNKG